MRLINADRCERGIRANICECVTQGHYGEAQKWQDVLSYIQSVPTTMEVEEKESD